MSSGSDSGSGTPCYLCYSQFFQGEVEKRGGVTLRVAFLPSKFKKPLLDYQDIGNLLDKIRGSGGSVPFHVCTPLGDLDKQQGE